MAEEKTFPLPPGASLQPSQAPGPQDFALPPGAAMQPPDYSWGQVPGAAVKNFVPNAVDTFHGIKDYVTQRGAAGTAADIGKGYVGMWQKFIPGQQEWEKQYFDPAFHGAMQHYGADKLRQGDVEGAGKQFRRALAEQPFQTLIDVGGIGGGMPGRVGGAARAVSPVHKAENVAERIVTPLEADKAHLAASKTLKKEGIPQTAGQRSGNTILRYAESEIGMGATAKKVEAQQRAYTRAAAKRLGLQTDELSEETMTKAQKDIGGRIGSATAGYNLRVSGTTRHKAAQITQRYLDNVEPGKKVGLVEKVNDHIQNNRILTPDNYQELRSQLGDAARTADSYESKKALMGIQRTLDEAMERGLPPRNAAQLKEARQQYRNWLIVKEALTRPGEAVKSGMITPGALDAAIKAVVGKDGYVKGGHDFGKLGKHGVVGMPPMPQSGTAPRAWAYSVPFAVGGAMASEFFGGSPGISAGAAITGATAPWMVGKGLMSSIPQGYFGNQVAPWARPVTAPFAAAIPPGVSFLSHEAETGGWGD